MRNLRVGHALLLGGCALLLAFWADPAGAATGGPDAGKYRYIDNLEAGGPAWSYTSIAGTTWSIPDYDAFVCGIQLNGGIGGPFKFRFYGTEYTDVCVHENGYIGFVGAQLTSTAPSWTPVTIPSGALPNEFVAPLFLDLDSIDCPGAPHTVTLGTEPERTFIAEWTNINLWDALPCSAGTVSMQLHLEEKTGDIYLKVQDGTYTDFQTPGGSVQGGQIGIEKGAGFGLQYALFPDGASPTVANRVVHYFWNRPPDAVDDTATTYLQTPITIDVLQNDADPDGDAMTVAIVTVPDEGGAAIASNKIVYTPDASVCYGSDEFEYTITDGNGKSDTAKVTVTIPNCNKAPVATDGTVAATEDAALSASLGSFVTDLEGDALTYTVVAAPATGTFALTDASTGAFTYTPPADSTAGASFTYKAQDAYQTSATKTVTITVAPVNDAPVAVAPSGTTITPEETPVSVTLSGTDIDSTGLTYAIAVAPTKGTVSPASGPIGAATYTPFVDATGSDTFTFRVSDGALWSAPASASLAITNVNDVPVAVDDAYLDVLKDTAYAPAAGVLQNDLDADGEPLQAILLTPPAHHDPAAPAFGLTAAGMFNYKPKPGFTGDDSFTYRAQDGAGTGSTATVKLRTVCAGLQAVDDTYAAAEDTTLTVAAAAGVRGNDIVWAAPASVTAAVVTGAAKGTVTMAADGAFTYVPHADAFGQDTFTYRLLDGSSCNTLATVTVNVAAAADAPTALDDAFTVAEDTLSTLPVTQNDGYAPDGPETLQVVAVSDPGHGSATIGPAPEFRVHYTPDPDYNGPDAFTYLVSDGTLTAQALATITVLPVQDAPRPEPDRYATRPGVPLIVSNQDGVLGNDVDGDGDPMQAVLLHATGGGVLDLLPDGGFRYDPQPGFTGTDGFLYAPGDGFAQGPATAVTITVRAGSPPVAAFTLGAAEVAAGTPVPLRDASADPDGDIVAWEWDFGDGQAGLGPGPLHAYSLPGIYTVRLTVADSGGATSSTQQTVVVTDTANAERGGPYDGVRPVADAGPDQRVEEGTLVQLGPVVPPGGVRLARWSQVSGPPALLSGAGTLHAAFLASLPQDTVEAERVFELTWFDGHLQSVPDQVRIATYRVADPAIYADGGGDRLAVEGSIVRLEGNAFGIPGAKLSWRQLSGPSVGLGEAAGKEATFRAPVAGSRLAFELLATAPGVARTDTVHVDVISLSATRGFAWERSDARLGLVRFQSLMGEGQEVTWAFGDGGQATGPVVDHVYALSGTYTVTMTASGPDGERTFAQDVPVVAQARALAQPESRESPAIGDVALAGMLALGALARPRRPEPA